MATTKDLLNVADAVVVALVVVAMVEINEIVSQETPTYGVLIVRSTDMLLLTVFQNIGTKTLR